MKKSFLAIYDYETGGIWLVINARSPEEITRKYPELQVVDVRPSWMTQEAYDDLESRMTFDIDDEPSGWLGVLVSGRSQ
jgi:hypothetical protein